MWPKWRSFTKWFSQIWLHIKMQVEKSTESFYILFSYLLELIMKSSDFEKENFKIWQIFGLFFS